MSDFLTRVSRVALGLTPVVQALGPSRYAPGPDLRTDESLFEEREGSEPFAAHGERVSPVAGESPTLKRRNIAEPAAPSLTLADTDFRSDGAAPFPGTLKPRAERPEIALRANGRAADQPTEIVIGAGNNVNTNVQSIRTEVEQPASPLPVISRLNASSPIPSSDDHRDHSPAIPERLRPTVDPSREAGRKGFSTSAVVSESSALEVTDSNEAPMLVRSPQRPAFEATAEVVARDQEQHSSAVHRDDSPTARSSERDNSEHIASVFRRPNRLPIHERPDTETSPAPIIRVTIGRIEVRAPAPPPPPVEAPAPPPPRISLDDFLRSSSGRTR